MEIPHRYQVILKMRDPSIDDGLNVLTKFTLVVYSTRKMTTKLNNLNKDLI